MKYRPLILLTFLSFSLLLFSKCNSKKAVELQVNEADKKVDVLVDGKLFTSYIYPDKIKNAEKNTPIPIVADIARTTKRSINAFAYNTS